ncbi:hypothetical protein IW140_006404, partial [Coemansia sp. RSA 1813]
RLTAPVAGSFDFATVNNCYTTQDNSVCLGSWAVPENLVPGKTYHFVWFWYFNQNPAGEWYSTCFDMQISDSSHVVGTAPMATLLQKGDPPDSYVYGLNGEAKSLIAQVTTFLESQASTGSAVKPTTASIAEIGRADIIADATMPTSGEAPASPAGTGMTCL